MTALAPALQAWFTERLITQRNSSPRDDRRLPRRVQAAVALRPRADRQAAVRAGHRRSRRAADRRVPQTSRRRPGQQRPTRNARLGAIHSFYRFAALEHPEHAHTIARVMAIPTKRYERNTVNYLDRDEIAALLAAPTEHTWHGRRDHALLAAHDPNRRQGLRAHRPARRRRSPRHRRPHPGLGKGPQETRHNPDRRDRPGPTHMDHRTPRPARRAPIPNPARTSTQPLHGSACSSPSTPPPRSPTARRWRPSAPPRTRSGTPTRCCSEPRASTSRRSRCGSGTNHPDHAHLRARRPRSQRASDRTNRPTRHQARPIPTIRHAPRVP